MCNEAWRKGLVFSAARRIHVNVVGRMRGSRIPIFWPRTAGGWGFIDPHADALPKKKRQRTPPSKGNDPRRKDATRSQAKAPWDNEKSLRYVPTSNRIIAKRLLDLQSGATEMISKIQSGSQLAIPRTTEAAEGNTDHLSAPLFAPASERHPEHGTGAAAQPAPNAPGDTHPEGGDEWVRPPPRSVSAAEGLRRTRLRNAEGLEIFEVLGPTEHEPERDILEEVRVLARSIERMFGAKRANVQVAAAALKARELSDEIVDQCSFLSKTQREKKTRQNGRSGIVSVKSIEGELLADRLVRLAMQPSFDKRNPFKAMKNPSLPHVRRRLNKLGKDLGPLVGPTEFLPRQNGYVSRSLKNVVPRFVDGQIAKALIRSNRMHTHTLSLGILWEGPGNANERHEDQPEGMPQRRPGQIPIGSSESGSTENVGKSGRLSQKVRKPSEGAKPKKASTRLDKRTM
jgi:hypothetical protein